MNRSEFLFIAAALVVCAAVVVFGGLYHPNTLAGSVARFVFSLK